VENLLSFLVANFALTGSPGPNTLSLAAAGAAFGIRRSLPFMAGLTVGMAGVMGVVATGVAAAVVAVPGVMPVLLAASMTYFGYLAYRIATAPALSEPAGTERTPSFAAGVLQCFINPKAYAAMAALFSGFVLVRDRVDLDVAAKMALTIAIIVVVNIIWLLSGAALTRLFRDPRSNRILNAGFALALVASVVLAFLV
jgi:threonine/homoserine/homoserine lactone efflux protein